MNDHATRFRALHTGAGLLRLANCWDAASARVLEQLGAPALATTSAGLCWSNGYPDGAALPTPVLVAAVRSITRVIRVPLSVDVEDGYSADPAVVAATVVSLADAGVVGINVEDGAGPPQVLAAKIARIRSAVARAGHDVFVNARTDVYLRELVPGEDARVEESARRARQYRDAGADGIFVPKLVDAGSIQALVDTVGLPLNVLAWPGLPPVEELATLGVRRVSAGSALAQLAYGRAAAGAASFLRDGRTDHLTDGAMPYGELNALFRAAEAGAPAPTGAP